MTELLSALNPVSMNTFPSSMYLSALTCHRKRGLTLFECSSAFQPVRKVKAVAPSDAVRPEPGFEAKCDADFIPSGKGGSSICLSDGSTKINGGKGKVLENVVKTVGREKKLLKNRESACKSRLKKKAIMQTMKEQVDRLTKENAELSSQVISNNVINKLGKNLYTISRKNIRR